jgi:YhcH/YjgK/YiaL family protein
MIVDTLDNLEKYVSVNPLFADVVKFIKENDLNTLEEGKHLIKDKDLFVNIQVAKGKTEEAANFETHKNMLDIQIPLDAPESYGYMPLCDMPAAEYNAEKDVTKYPGLKAETMVNCKPGEFAIFFPWDGHQPCIGEGNIRKAIFKVKSV